jgi:type I restriction enzyme S subunit
LDEYLKSVFWEMFGDPVNNPKSWEKRLLGDVTDLITDGKHGDSINEENSGYYFISAKDIHDGIIDYSNARQIIKKDFEEVHRRTNLYPGDLIIVNTGATIGKVAIAKEDHRTQRTTFQKSVAVIKLKKNFINNHYLKFLFGLRLKDLFRTSTGSAQQNLLLSQMRKIVITCPPIQLQNQFVSIVEKVELLKHTMLTQSEELENQFQALMQKAFKGTL